MHSIPMEFDGYKNLIERSLKLSIAEATTAISYLERAAQFDYSGPNAITLRNKARNLIKLTKSLQKQVARMERR